jgi:c-di-GMP-binding flagellar brake protein YcgR
VLAFWAVVVSVLLALLLIWQQVYFRNKVKKQNNQIADMQHLLDDLQEQLKEKEKRDAFRLKLLYDPCHLEITDLGDPALEELIHKKAEGKIVDISQTGLKIICGLDLPVRKRIALNVNFKLLNHEFSFKGNVVRKEERLDNIIYGIEFAGNDPKEEQTLLNLLQKIEIERRKKMPT